SLWSRGSWASDVIAPVSENLFDPPLRSRLRPSRQGTTMTRRRILIRFASRCSALLLLVGSVACESGPAPEVDAPADPAQAGYRAQGNEPFWSLVLEQATMSFSQLGVDDTVRAERPAAERLEDGWRFAATASGEPFLVRIEDRRCSDSMSGRPFPHTIEVTVGDQVFTGCG